MMNTTRSRRFPGTIDSPATPRLGSGFGRLAGLLMASLVAFLGPETATATAAAVGSSSGLVVPGHQTTAPCVADNDTLCLVDGRFQVEVDYRTKTGATGSGTPVLFTDNAGLFWFFNDDNFEMLFKLLDGCSITNRYWVFFAATTNVGFTVTVTDTMFGQTVVYDNAIDNQADAITDTGAFDTCPSALTTPGNETLARASDLSALRSAAASELREELEQVRNRSLDTATLATAASSPELSPASEREADRGSTTLAPSIRHLEGRPVARIGRVSSASSIDSGRSVQPLRAIESGGALGPFGTTYEPEPLLGTDIDGDGFTDLFTLQPLGGNGNVVTFDGIRENLKAYDPELGLTTVPRMQESVETVSLLRFGSGIAAQNKLRIVLTMDTRDGDDLFPAGFTAGQGGPALDMAAIAVGLFGGDPLDFPNLGVSAASFELFAGQTSIERFDIPANELADFFPLAEVWDGSFGVVFDQVVGLDINRVVTTIEVQTAAEPFDCVVDEKTHCLGASGRFQVRVRWTKPSGETGDGLRVAIPGSTSSGLFYFFDPDNLEMLFKLLDGCSINNRFWAFFAATTNVEFELEVIDSMTGVATVYTNPQGNPAKAITDTGAFSCP